MGGRVETASSGLVVSLTETVLSRTSRYQYAPPAATAENRAAKEMLTADMLVIL